MIKKQVYKVDAEGLLVEISLAYFDDKENPIVELADNIITVKPQNGLYHAKWTGKEWVEDMLQEEIDELNNQPRELTKEELLEQRINDLELYILTMEGLI